MLPIGDGVARVLRGGPPVGNLVVLAKLLESKM